MAVNSPQEQAGMRASVGLEIERVSDASARHLDDLIGNARWFTTLVVAEVAALAKLIHAASGWALAIITLAVVLLALSVGCLVFALRAAQAVKDQVQSQVAEMLLDLPTVDFAAASPHEVAALLADLKKIVNAVTGRESEHQARLTAGLMLFLSGSLVAGVALFIR